MVGVDFYVHISKIQPFYVCIPSFQCQFRLERKLFWSLYVETVHKCIPSRRRYCLFVLSRKCAKMCASFVTLKQGFCLKKFIKSVKILKK